MSFSPTLGQHHGQLSEINRLRDQIFIMQHIGFGSKEPVTLHVFGSLSTFMGPASQIIHIPRKKEIWSSVDWH